jgi:hypothetical protein
VAQALNEMAAQLEAARLRLVTESNARSSSRCGRPTLAVAGKPPRPSPTVSTLLNIISGRAEFLKTAELEAAARSDVETIVA